MDLKLKFIRKVKIFCRIVCLYFCYILLFTRYILIRNGKKILFIPQNSFEGGTGTFTHSFIHFALDNAFKLILIIPDKELSKYQDQYNFNHFIFYTYGSELDMPEHYYSLKHSLFKYFRFEVLKQQVYFLSLAIKYKAKSIVISVAHPGRFMSAFLFPGKVIYFIHTMPWIQLDTGNQSILHIQIQKKQKQLITVSNYAKKEIIKFWLLEKFQNKIQVIHNYYEQKYTYPKPAKNYLQILTLGNLIQDKNPEVWLRVAIELTQIYGVDKLRFVWAGSGPLLEQYRKKIILYPNIQFVGWIADVDKLYGESDIYLQPSYSESHGIAVVGAMSHGLPCVVTNKGGTTESIIQNFNGYTCDTKVPNQVVDFLIKLIENSELRNEFGKNGMDRYRKMFKNEIWEKKMALILQA